MAAKKKKPEYQQNVLKPEDEVRKDGNETRELDHLVWMLDGDNALMLDEQGNPQRCLVKEKYTFNGQHRQFALGEKSVWRIQKDDELNIFKRMRWCGHYTHWKKDTCKGWGVFISPNTETILFNQKYKIQVLGSGYNREELVICKFVEGNAEEWHGYPINHTLRNEDTIPERIVRCWWKSFGVIEKSDYNDIRTKHAVSLL